MRDWPPCPPIQRDSGRRSRPGVNPFISALTVARCPATFPGVWPQLRDTLSTSWSVGRGTGAFIYAFSCYPALRLYRLSKSPRGIDVVSLTLGNSCLPSGNGSRRYAKLFCKLFLCKIFFLTALFQKSSYLFCVHVSTSLSPTAYQLFQKIPRHKPRIT